MLDDRIVVVLKTVTAVKGISLPAAEQLRQDPTSFMGEVFRSVGIQVPEGFHAHIVKEGEGLPEEPHRSTTDRDVYFARLNGEVEHQVIKGTPDGQDYTLAQHEISECCKCGLLCCVVEVP